MQKIQRRVDRTKTNCDDWIDSGKKKIERRARDILQSYTWGYVSFFGALFFFLINSLVFSSSSHQERNRLVHGPVERFAVALPQRVKLVQRVEVRFAVFVLEVPQLVPDDFRHYRKSVGSGLGAVESELVRVHLCVEYMPRRMHMCVWACTAGETLHASKQKLEKERRPGLKEKKKEKKKGNEPKDLCCAHVEEERTKRPRGQQLIEER